MYVTSQYFSLFESCRLLFFLKRAANEKSNAITNSQSVQSICMVIKLKLLDTLNKMFVKF